MLYNLGKVSYINSLPLFTAESPFDIRAEIPSKLNNLVENNQLDISLISRWIYPKVQKNYKVVPNFCIASNGEIMSVKIFAKFPLNKLKDKKIYITPSSGSSIRAFRFLIEKKYNYDIFAMQQADVNSADAVLLIGDSALTFDNTDFEFTYDLGTMWKESFDTYLVYAVAVIKNDLYTNLSEDLSNYFDNSLKNFYENKSRFILEAQNQLENSSKYKMSVDVLAKYFSKLTYKLQNEDFEKSFNFISNITNNEYIK